MRRSNKSRTGAPIRAAVVSAAAVIFFGIIPSPLFDVAKDVGTALQNVFL